MSLGLRLSYRLTHICAGQGSPQLEHQVRDRVLPRSFRRAEDKEEELGRQFNVFEFPFPGLSFNLLSIFIVMGGQNSLRAVALVLPLSFLGGCQSAQIEDAPALSIVEDAPAPDTAEEVISEIIRLLEDVEQTSELLRELEYLEPVLSQEEGESRLRETLWRAAGIELDGNGAPGTPLAMKYSDEEITKARIAAENLAQSTVVISTSWFEDGFSYTGDATAWMVSPSVAITNDHNLGDSYDLNYIDPAGIAIYDLWGNEYGVERYLALSPEFDVAAVLLDSDHPGPFVDLNNLSDGGPGDVVVAVGHPGQMGYWVRSIGRVTLVRPGRDVYSGPNGVSGGSLHTDIGISKGSSGSAVVDLDGRLVGILHSSPSLTSDRRSSDNRSGEVFSVFPGNDESFGTSGVDILRLMSGLLE